MCTNNRQSKNNWSTTFFSAHTKFKWVKIRTSAFMSKQVENKFWFIDVAAGSVTTSFFHAANRINVCLPVWLVVCECGVQCALTVARNGIASISIFSSFARISISVTFCFQRTRLRCFFSETLNIKPKMCTSKYELKFKYLQKEKR